jgi:intein/homing endonuclease
MKANRARYPRIDAMLDRGARADWVAASQLAPGSVLAYPVLTEKEDRATLPADGLGELPVDDDLMTLFGYYLAEGTLSGKDGKPYQQFFYFHEREVPYVERLQAILRGLGVKPSVRYRRHTAAVIAHSLALGRLLEGLFGRGATRKCLPEWMLRLPHDKQRALVRALWEGDGHVGRVAGYWRATYCTSSWDLGVQVHQMLLRLGIAASLRHRDQPGRQRNWVIAVTSQPSLQRLGEILGEADLTAAGPARTAQAVVRDGVLYVGVRAVRRVPWKGHVHNLEVEGAHSFVVPGAALHNCEVNGPGEARVADIGVAGGRGIGLIFKRGEVIRKVPEKDIRATMREEVDKFLAERKAETGAV